MFNKIVWVISICLLIGIVFLVDDWTGGDLAWEIELVAKTSVVEVPIFIEDIVEADGFAAKLDVFGDRMIEYDWSYDFLDEEHAYDISWEALAKMYPELDYYPKFIDTFDLYEVYIYPRMYFKGVEDYTGLLTEWCDFLASEGYAVPTALSAYDYDVLLAKEDNESEYELTMQKDGYAIYFTVNPALYENSYNVEIVFSALQKY